MSGLPPIAPLVGASTRIRLARDYYVRIAGNDYSVDPTMIGRFVDVHAGLTRVTIRCVGVTVKRIVYAWGLNLVVVCLRVAPPWGGTLIALPINLRARTTTGGNKTTELAAELIEEIADWLPERSFHLTGDGAYACLLGAQLPRTHVTSRMRRDTGCMNRRRHAPANAAGLPSKAAGWASHPSWAPRHRTRPGPRSPSTCAAATSGASSPSSTCPATQCAKTPWSAWSWSATPQVRNPTTSSSPPTVRRQHRHRQPLRRSLANRVLLQRSQATRRRRTPPKLDRPRPGPRGHARLLVTHRHLVRCYLASWNDTPTWRTRTTPARGPQASSTPSPHCAGLRPDCESSLG